MKKNISLAKRVFRKGKKLLSEVKKRTKLYFTRLSMNYGIMTEIQTLDTIVKEKCSIARFGDGEFGIILGGNSIHFQQSNDDVARELKTVLSSGNEKLLVCIPHTIKSTHGLKKEAADFWRNWVLGNGNQVITLIKSTVPDYYRFGDTQVTRPYIDWKSKNNASKVYQRFKELWREKDIIVVEGTHTRLGVGNDLLDSAKSIKRIICPATNAFGCKSKIFEAIMTLHTNELVLLALGPTATVLASDLTKAGIQALDVGHLDVEYEWFLSGATSKSAVPGKYVNEVPAGRDSTSECRDELYVSQIVASITD